MARTDRLFEVIQILRAENKAITAEQIAERLEVSIRTIYRDIQTLMAMRTPIEGEPGVGYMIKQGYDLPPLNFSVDEIEAIVVGLSLLKRTGDKGLQKAAVRVSTKISTVQQSMDRLLVSDWGVEESNAIGAESFRVWIREERKLSITYRDVSNIDSRRKILPIAITYLVEKIILVGWCELREDFRHFRIDRIIECKPLEHFFKRKGVKLRQQWRVLYEYEKRSDDDCMDKVRASAKCDNINSY